MKVQEEVWLPVYENYTSPKYEVSCFGNVRNIKTGEIITPRITKNGYSAVGKFLVHQAVAKLFLYDSYKEGYEVNHKDGNKQNNHYENLEWVTKSYNQKHAFENVLKDNCYGTFILEKLPEEHKKKISNSLKGKKHSESRVLNRSKKLMKKIVQETLDGEFIQMFNSIGEASEKLGLSYARVGRLCRGTVKIKENYKLRFLEEIR